MSPCRCKLLRSSPWGPRDEVAGELSPVLPRSPVSELDLAPMLLCPGTPAEERFHLPPWLHPDHSAAAALSDPSCGGRHPQSGAVPIPCARTAYAPACTRCRPPGSAGSDDSSCNLRCTLCHRGDGTQSRRGCRSDAVPWAECAEPRSTRPACCPCRCPCSSACPCSWTCSCR